MSQFIILIAVLAFFVSLQIAYDYISTQFVKTKPEVVMDYELKNVTGMDNFIEELLKELSSEWIEEYAKGKSKSEREFAGKYWTLGKITNVYLQYFEDDNSFSISITAKKLGNYTGYNLISLKGNEIVFRVHSFQKSLFQPSFFVTYFSEDNIPVKELKKFNYKMAV